MQGTDASCQTEEALAWRPPIPSIAIGAIACRRSGRRALLELAAHRVIADGPPELVLNVVIRDGKSVDEDTRRRMLLTDAELVRGIAPEAALADLSRVVADLPAFIYAEHESVADQLSDALLRYGQGSGVHNLVHLGPFVVPGRFLPSLRDVALALGVDAPLVRRARQESELLATVLAPFLQAATALPAPLLAECEESALLLRWPNAPGLSAVVAAAAGRARDTPSSQRIHTLLCGRYDVARPERPESAPPDSAQIDAILGPGGAVSHLHAGYEHRPEQIAMAREVVGAFARDEILLVEAGTGVGKSLAYLIPSILWAAATGERIAVSTATKNLQEQLIRKDIPFLARVLDVPFRATVVKGRENYICTRKLVDAYARLRASLFEADRLAAIKLLAWAALSDDRDLSELGTAERGLLTGTPLETPPEGTDAPGGPNSEPGLSLRAQAETCHRRACTLAAGCAIERLRRRAQASDVVIINHALFFSTGPGIGVLPAFARIVFDEAHQIEDICTEHLGHVFASRDAERLLGHLARAGDHEAIFARIGAAVGSSPDVLGEQLNTGQHRQVLETATQVEALRQHLGELAGSWCDELCGHPQASRLRLRPDAFSGELGAQFRATAFDLVSALRVLVEGVRTTAAEFEEREGLDLLGPQAYANELTSVADVLEEAAYSLEVVVAQEDRRFVYWLDAHRTGFSLHAAPIDVGPILAESLFSTMKSVVLTSATLTVEGDTRFIRQRLGVDLLSAERVTAAVFPSSFDYERQALLAIPTDAPLPNEEAWSDYASQCIVDLLSASRGRGLVLFTARAMMDRVFDACAAPLRSAGIPAQCQYRHGSRADLQAELISNRESVLFATRSFFGGVDIPGDALECVIITKLPFAVPSDPLIEARCEALEAEGVNPMTEFYIPHAIMVFRQAFGRLIRSRRDRGVIAVLDRRLLQRSYGPRFLDSIPHCAQSRRDTRRIVADVREFLRD